MFLEQITRFSELGAQQPVFLWKEKYTSLASQILPPLEQAAEKMNTETLTFAATKHLVALLRENQPDEFALAKNLQTVAKAFTTNVPEKNTLLINRLTPAIHEFVRRAQIFESHRKKRAELKRSFSAEQINDHDFELFNSTGLTYCLEYYLAIYKAITIQPTEAQQRWYIERPSVNLGSGSVPGVWKDMNADEVLEKFMLSVLDDGVRESLIKSYYSAKIELMKVVVDCADSEQCTAAYTDTSVPQIIAAIKQFNQDLLGIFRNIGIERLKSVAFTPYGVQPRLDQIYL